MATLLPTSRCAIDGLKPARTWQRFSKAWRNVDSAQAEMHSKKRQHSAGNSWGEMQGAQARFRGSGSTHQ